MTATVHKIKNIITYLVPSTISNILPILTFPIMTRFLTPEDFGISALVIATVGMITSVATCNISSATQRYYFEYRKDPDKLSQLINSSFLFLLIMFVVSIVFLSVGINFISKIVMGSSKYAFPILIAYAGNYFSLLVNLYLLLYRNMERAKEFSFFTIVLMLTNVLFTLVMASVFKMGYMSLIYPTLISSLLVFICLCFRSMREYPFQFSAKVLFENLVYSVPLLINLLTTPIYQFFDKYLLRALVSLESTGIFSIAQNIANKLFVFMTAVQSTFHPIMMKDMFDKGKDGAAAVGRNFTIFTYISLAAVLPAILFAEEIIYVLAPKSYYNVINVFMIALCGVATQTFGKVVGLPLEYAKKAYLSFPIILVNSFINVGLNLILIPKYGAAGAAFAMTMTIIFINLLSIVVSHRYYKIKYDWVILFCLFANIFIATSLLVFFRSIDANFVFKYLVKGLSLAAFILTGIKTGIVSKRNLEAMVSIIVLKKKRTGSIETESLGETGVTD